MHRKGQQNGLPPLIAGDVGGGDAAVVDGAAAAAVKIGKHCDLVLAAVTRTTAPLPSLSRRAATLAPTPRRPSTRSFAPARPGDLACDEG